MAKTIETSRGHKQTQSSKKSVTMRNVSSNNQHQFMSADDNN